MTTVQYPLGTAGRRLGITRIISKNIGDLPWTFAYDADGRLVTMMPRDEYENKVLEKFANPEQAAAAEFQHLFRTDSWSDDSELDDDGASSFADPVGNLVRKIGNDALSKGVDGVRDCSWDAPLESPVDEAFEKACASARSTMEEFIKRNGHLLGSHRLDCSSLLKSFREENTCQGQ